MCTASVVASPTGVRLVCNRDERVTRPVARPPAVHQTGAGVAIYPVDPQSSGSWIGVADRAFAAVLLNRTLSPRVRRRSPATSRGIIVPLVLAQRSFGDAIEAAARLDVERFDPFALILVDRSRAAGLASDGTMRRYGIDRPLLFTPSSLGDEMVEPPRRALFDAMVARAENPLDGQSHIHRHHWPSARHLSVLMQRRDATTVSRTTIDLSASAMRVRYEPLPAPDTSEPARVA